ncbi:hypothetical protein JG688_00015692 [Phytophthora aleatoria]|uniref:Uncharacterized protein n=1 Tax=Phytophthora aleatoria TaxID=2496075 RepID=A0A8J5I9N9_9STRA|nr:hypothetical protein JG688_00015692 [Phytophthora aleatoria]
MASSIMTELGSTVPLVERISRLASLVQYLLTPVIGGYLAYVGFFMIKGGDSLTYGREPCLGWAVLMSSSYSLTLGLIGGIMLSILTTYLSAHARRVQFTLWLLFNSHAGVLVLDFANFGQVILPPN